MATRPAVVGDGVVTTGGPAQPVVPATPLTLRLPSGVSVGIVTSSARPMVVDVALLQQAFAPIASGRRRRHRGPAKTCNTSGESTQEEYQHRRAPMVQAAQQPHGVVLQQRQVPILQTGQRHSIRPMSSGLQTGSPAHAQA